MSGELGGKVAGARALHVQRGIAALAAAVGDIAVLEGIVQQGALVAGGVGDGVGESLPGRCSPAAGVKRAVWPSASIDDGAVGGGAELEREAGERRFNIADERVEVDIDGRGLRGGECARVGHGRIGDIDAGDEAGA